MRNKEGVIPSCNSYDETGIQFCEDIYYILRLPFSDYLGYLSPQSCLVPLIPDNATRTRFQSIRVNSGTQENERDRASTEQEKRGQQNYDRIVAVNGRVVDLNCTT